jgi:GT2 family glycosyltransferase
LLASVIITTYNRAEALSRTVGALDHQDAQADAYEIIVVDDGSTDDTESVLRNLETSAPLVVLRHDQNRGVSAGRNSAIAIARGRYLIFLSDDLVVPPSFVNSHVRTLERLPNAWVVGGFRQLESLTGTPFGRYLSDLESDFDAQRKVSPLGDDLWEMSWPTARNLSLRRTDLNRTGLFDERFRIACEDQDLAERAKASGIHFIYDAAIDCLHNDANASLERYCRLQERGAFDTVLFALKNPRHASSPIALRNGPIGRGDRAGVVFSKAGKTALGWSPVWRLLLGSIGLLERSHVPERVLRSCYRVAIGVAIARGWRSGLKRYGDPSAQLAHG